MGLFDTYVMTGNDNRVCSITSGIVKNNYDKEHPGMIQAEIFLGEKGKNLTGWIPVASFYAGKDFGAYALPEIGSEVIIAFNMGDRNCPVVIGSLWNDVNEVMKNTVEEHNYVKRFKTKGGCEVIFTDEKDKENIKVITPKQLSFTLDDENQKIVIQDKDAKNAININTKDGSISIEADKKIELKVGGKALVTLDGSSKKVEMNADNVEIKGGQKLALNGQNTAIEGNMMSIKGKSKLGIESSAIAELKGSMVKIN